MVTEQRGEDLDRALRVQEQVMLMKATNAFFPNLLCEFCGCHGQHHTVTFHEFEIRVHMIHCQRCARELRTNQVVCWRWPGAEDG